MPEGFWFASIEYGSEGRIPKPEKFAFDTEA